MASLHASEAPNDYPTEHHILRDLLADATYASYTDLIAAYESHAFSRGYAVVLADSKGLNRPNKLGRRIIEYHNHAATEAVTSHPSVRRAAIDAEAEELILSLGYAGT